MATAIDIRGYRIMENEVILFGYIYTGQTRIGFDAPGDQPRTIRLWSVRNWPPPTVAEVNRAIRSLSRYLLQNQVPLDPPTLDHYQGVFRREEEH
jgi:hypothetical protein